MEKLILGIISSIAGSVLMIKEYLELKRSEEFKDLKRTHPNKRATSNMAVSRLIIAFFMFSMGIFLIIEYFN